MKDVGRMIVQEEGGATNNKYEAGMKKTGTKATFEGKGGKKPGYLPADTVLLCLSGKARFGDCR